MEMNNIKTSEALTSTDEMVGVQLQRPKRVLHFSDGVMEEFEDSDEVARKHEIKESTAVLGSELQWGPWLFYKASIAGSTILHGCDYVGESLASFLGITSPKYESEIAEFKRTQAENDKIAQEIAEHASWMEKENLHGEVIVNDLAASKADKF